MLFPSLKTIFILLFQITDSYSSFVFQPKYSRNSSLDPTLGQDLHCTFSALFSLSSITVWPFCMPNLAHSQYTTHLLKNQLNRVLTVMLGEGNGTPLQYSCLENPMDGGAWWATVHGVAKSRTRLSDFTFTFHFRALEKEMATHSSVLAWRIPGTGEPGGLPSMGSHRVGHD